MLTRRPDPGVAIHDRAFSALTQRISVQIFKLNANVIGINKCVDVLGSAADSPSVRKKLCARSIRRSADGAGRT